MFGRTSFSKMLLGHCRETAELSQLFIEDQHGQRDIPAYNKYELTKETKEALKTVDFDVWDWEPNEVIS